MHKKPWWYYPIIYMYHKCRSYDVWFLRYKAQQTEFLSFWSVFCPLTLSATWKIKTLKKWKTYLKILSFYTCTPWCMASEIWSMTDRIFCHLGLFFAFLPSLTTQKVKILKKKKKKKKKPSRAIIILYKCTRNHDNMLYCYTVPEIWHLVDVIFNF